MNIVCYGNRSGVCITTRHMIETAPRSKQEISNAPHSLNGAQPQYALCSKSTRGKEQSCLGMDFRRYHWNQIVPTASCLGHRLENFLLSDGVRPH